MCVEVVGLGAVNYDILYAVERIAKGGEEAGILGVTKEPGGSAANTIVGLSRLGVSAGFVGVVGSDEAGSQILADFRREGVEARLRREEGETGTAIGFVDPRGERALYIFPGVNDRLGLAEVEAEMDFLCGARFLHTSSFVGKEQLEVQRELASRLRRRLKPSVHLSFSPGMLCFKHGLEDLVEVVGRSEVVFFSAGELKSLVGEKENYESRAEAILNCGAKIVCVTLGERGCFVAGAGGEKHLINTASGKGVVDTTGAGDAFAAGFLFGLLHEEGLYECGKTGNLVASFCIREYGCRSGLPYSLEG